MKIEEPALELVAPDPNNPRSQFSEIEQAELVASVKLHGVQVPCIGYRVKDHIILVDGHRRRLAAQAAGLASLPMIVLDHPPDASERLVLQLTLNCQRQDLNAVELYDAFSSLAKIKNWSPGDLASNLGVSNAKVTRILALGKLTADERLLVREGKIPGSSAYALARMPADERAGFVAKAARGEVTRDALNARARRSKAAPAVNKSSRISCELADGTVTVCSRSGLDLPGLVELLEGLLREFRKARSQKLDLSTAVRVLRDQAKAS